MRRPALAGRPPGGWRLRAAVGLCLAALLAGTAPHPPLRAQTDDPAAAATAAGDGAALREAARTDDRDVISRLLAAGADPDAADEEGVTPLMLAVSGPDPLVRQLATEGFGDDVRRNVERMKRAIAPNREAARLLIQAGADVNRATPRGITALALAAMGDELEMLEHLLRAGAAVNHRAKRGETALMVAAAAGSTGSAKRLLAAGADPALKTRDGLTASLIAILAGNLETARAIAER